MSVQLIPASILVAIALGQSSTHWPQIIETQREYEFSQKSGQDTPVLLALKDIDYRDAYRFECHNGDYNEDRPITFSGFFQCAIFALKDGAIASDNLLAARTPDEQHSDWMNRGRFLLQQLRGSCAEIPEYGSTRTFRFRNISVRLQITDLVLDSHDGGVAKRFRVKLSVVPDQTAASSAAVPPEIARPVKHCGW